MTSCRLPRKPDGIFASPNNSPPKPAARHGYSPWRGGSALFQQSSARPWPFVLGPSSVPWSKVLSDLGRIHVLSARHREGEWTTAHGPWADYGPRTDQAPRPLDQGRPTPFAEPVRGGSPGGPGGERLVRGVISEGTKSGLEAQRATSPAIRR